MTSPPPHPPSSPDRPPPPAPSRRAAGSPHPDPAGRPQPSGRPASGAAGESETTPLRPLGPSGRPTPTRILPAAQANPGPAGTAAPGAASGAEPPSGRPPQPDGAGPVPPSRSGNRLKLAAAVAIAVALVAASVLIFTGGSKDGGGPVVATPPAPTQAPAPAPADCRYPAQILDLTGWNITVPTPSESRSEDEDDRDGAKEVSQPELGTYVQRPWFTPNATCDGVVFRAPVNGKTTDNSGYPRSELREMTADGSKTAGWSSSTGTHTLVVDEAFTALPRGKPNVVGAQIHDGDDDVSVFRLEGSKLYVTKGDDSNYKLLTDSYVLGTRFEAKYEVSRDTIRAFYNGELVATIPARFSEAYFKAGIYTQANCKDRSVPCNSDNFGETAIYRVKVEHS